MKFIKKITSVMIAGALCIGYVGIENMESFKNSDTLLVADAAVTVWDGTADTSWYDSEETEMHISTAEELAGLASIVNGGKGMTGQTIILDSDIYLSSDLTDEVKHNWISISGFTGTFEGNNHTIYGLYNPSGGLFDYIKGTVQNLSLKEAVITGKSSSSDIIGTLANWNYGTIENCSVEADATANGKYYGGICGYNTGAIAECVNSGSINGLEYCSYVGGICGYNIGTVTYCENNANIIYNADGDYYGNYVGGIIGFSSHEGNVTNLRNKGNIFVKSGSGVSCGGVIGEAGSDITNCVSDGNIESDAECDCGGIAGLSGHIKFENCINNGEITLNNYIPVEAYNYASGGIVGRVNPGYWLDNDSTSDSDCELKFIKCGNNGNIIAYGETGGLAGCISYNIFDRYFANFTCIYSYNKGNVIPNEYGYGGGLFGYIAGTNKETCATIESSYNLGNIDSKSYYNGGLIGTIDNDDGNKLNIINSFSAAETVSGSYPGGIAGSIKNSTNASFKNCYYLNSGASKGIGNQNSDVGITKSAANMKKEAFAESLGNAFIYNEGDYPILFWEADIPMLSIDKTTITLNELNQQETITPDTSYGGELVWSSSNENVATVDENGIVTAVGNGNCTITLIAGGAKATCEVTVAYEYYLKETRISMKPDLAVELKVYSRSNDEPISLEVTYSSSNEDVAEVNKRGVISANAPGVAEIHAFIGGMDLVCVVKVEGVRGDVNVDGVFNIADAVILQKWILAVPNTQLANWKAADLCEDDRLNVFDLCLMKQELISK